MTFTIHIHDSWAAIPVALSRVLLAVAALERPRQPGDDGDDLTELLAGMDEPEPAPVAPAPARPAPAPTPRPAPQPAPPPAAPRSLPQAGREPDRPARAFDGAPATGRQLYKWACDRKALPDVNAIGRSCNYPKRVTDWEPEQVATAYALLSGPPPGAYGHANGQAR
jgi:hypothetical protein